MRYRSNNLPNSSNSDDKEMLSLPTRKKIRKFVIITHLALIIIPFIILLVIQWFKPKPPERIRIRLVSLPSANAGKRSVAPPKKTQRNKVKKRVIKKTKPKVKKRVIKKTKPKAKTNKKTVTPSKRRILSANDIRISRDVVKTKPKPHKRLSPTDLEKNILKDWRKIKTSVKATKQYDGKQTISYSDRIGLYLKPIWQQPDKISLGGQTPEVTVRIDINGRGQVTATKIIRRSGISAMDNSIVKLLRNLSNVPPPYDKRSKRVTIIMTVEN